MCAHRKDSTIPAPENITGNETERFSFRLKTVSCHAVRFRFLPTPQQSNAVDCGVFAVKIAELVVRSASLQALLANMDAARLSILDRIVDVGGCM